MDGRMFEDLGFFLAWAAGIILVFGVLVGVGLAWVLSLIL